MENMRPDQDNFQKQIFPLFGGEFSYIPPTELSYIPYFCRGEKTSRRFENLINYKLIVLVVPVFG